METFRRKARRMISLSVTILVTVLSMIFGCLVAWIGDEKSGFLFSFSSSSSAGVWLVLVEPCPKRLLAASESKVVGFESHFFHSQKETKQIIF